MAAEMPEQVAVAPGAASVCFPWAHASSVVAALNALRTTLTSQLDARPLMTATLTDWTGSYRDGFDTVSDRLTTTASGLVEAIALRAGAVVTAAEGANDKQLVLNHQATLDLLNPFSESPAGGGSW